MLEYYITITKNRDKIAALTAEMKKERLYSKYGVFRELHYLTIKIAGGAYDYKTNRLIGYCCLSKNHSDYSYSLNDLGGYDIGIFIKKSYRRLGIGTELAKAIIKKQKGSIQAYSFGYRSKFWSKCSKKIDCGF